MDKHMVGKIARCGRGRLGLVTDRKEGPYPTGQIEQYWVGIGLDGEGPWTSRDPEVAFQSLEEYILHAVNNALRPAQRFMAV